MTVDELLDILTKAQASKHGSCEILVYPQSGTYGIYSAGMSEDEKVFTIAIDWKRE